MASKKQPNWIKPLAMAVLLCVLGYGAYWLEYSRKPKAEAQEEANKKLLDLKDSTVLSMVVVDGKRRFKIVCSEPDKNLCRPNENGKWKLEEPVSTKADDGNANALVTSIHNLSVSETIDLGLEETPRKRDELLKEYKLSKELLSDPGARRVEVTLAGGKAVSLYFGETHPVGDQLFSLRSDQDLKVKLVASYFKSTFEKDLGYWRDKKLFTILPADVQAFVLNRMKVSKKDGQWTIDPDLPGDIENIDGLISAATYLTAKGFASDNKTDSKARSALSGARLITKLELLPSQITMQLYEKGVGKNAQYYATVSNLESVFEMDPSTKKRVEKTLKDLRLSKLMTSVERYTAKKIEMRGHALGETPLVLTNKDGNWTFDSKEKVESGKTVDPEKMQALLEKLSSNQIIEFIPIQSAGSLPKEAASGVTYTVFEDGSDKKREFLIWKFADKVFAKDLMSARKELFRLDPSVKDKLLWERGFLNK